MKLVRYISIFSVMFGLFTAAAVAGPKQKRDVTFSKQVMVAGTQLEADEYVVQWDGTGPGVQLRFLHEGKEVASATGKVVQQKNPYSSITTNQEKDGSVVLTEVEFSDVTLILTPGGASTSQ